MTDTELFAPKDEQTLRLNYMGHVPFTGRYYDPSNRSPEASPAPYLKAILDASNLEALKYAIFKGMEKPIYRDDYENTTENLSRAIKDLSIENHEYDGLYTSMLAKLLAPDQLPVFEPESQDPSHWRSLRNERFYLTSLLSACESRPRSIEMFEASYSLLVLNDRRMRTRDQFANSTLHDDLLRVVMGHQTDRRMEKTWLAAMQQEESNDDECLFPHAALLRPSNAFYAFVTMPEDDKCQKASLESIIAIIPALVKGYKNTNGRYSHTKSNAVQDTLITLSYGLYTPEELELIQQSLLESYPKNRYIVAGVHKYQKMITKYQSN